LESPGLDDLLSHRWPELFAASVGSNAAVHVNKLMQFDATKVFVCGTIWTALTGGIAWLAARCRVKAVKRHAEVIAKSERRRNFLWFMDGWRTEIESENISVTASEFDHKCADFRREATKIRLDYGTGFWRLSNSLSSLHTGEIEEGAGQENPAGRDELLRRLDAVVNFVKAN